MALYNVAGTLYNTPGLSYNGVTPTVTQTAAARAARRASTIAEAVLGSHEPRSRLTVLDGDLSTILRRWEGGTSRTAILVGGSVRYDRNEMVRRHADLQLVNADGSLSPRADGDLLAPGAIVTVERGFAWPDGGVTYLTLLGRGVVTAFGADMAGTLTLSVADRSHLLTQSGGGTLGDDLSLPAGMTAEEALVTLWEPVLGTDITWDLDGGRRTIAQRSFNADDERLSIGVQLMADLGLEAFLDRSGNVVLRPTPDPSQQDVTRSFLGGLRASTTMSLARSGDRLPYNRTVVIAERADGTVIRATADVTDWSSPLHKDHIGLRQAPTYRSTQPPDQAAANAVAKALLTRYALFQDAVSGTFLPDPTLDEETVCEFVEPVSGTADRYLIEQVIHPVVTGTMSIGATKVVPVFALS